MTYRVRVFFITVFGSSYKASLCKVLKPWKRQRTFLKEKYTIGNTWEAITTFMRIVILEGRKKQVELWMSAQIISHGWNFKSQMNSKPCYIAFNIHFKITASATCSKEPHRNTITVNAVGVSQTTVRCTIAGYSWLMWCNFYFQFDIILTSVSLVEEGFCSVPTWQSSQLELGLVPTWVLKMDYNENSHIKFTIETCLCCVQVTIYCCGHVFL